MGSAGERRFVTVLFSDLKGFTSLSETLDPEDVRDIVDALFCVFRVRIEEQGGAVDKFIGDAVMAVFGAPVARGDEAYRAVCAGLGMQEELKKFNRERGLELRLRVGVNAGEVLWGSVGGDRPTAMGDAVNVAQRLEASAVPGTVLAGASVRRLSRGRVSFTARGAIAVKGRAEPVEAWEATALAGEEGARRPLVGRATELGRLAKAAAAGGLVEVVGEAGTGKTRLVEECLAALPPGTWTATGRFPESARLPYSALGDVARARAGSSDVGAVVARVAADLAQLGDDATAAENGAHLVAMSLGFALENTRVAAIEPLRRATETRVAWGRWLSSLGPAAIALEDIHWAGDESVQLLGTLAERLAGRGVAILLTTRTRGNPPAGFERLALGALEADDARLLLETSIGGKADERLAEFVRAKCAGHPGFIEEMGRFLVAEKLIEGPPYRIVGSAERIPEGLAGILTARLDALGEGARESLKAASVIGRSFWRRLLGEAWGRDPGPGLETSLASGVVECRDPGALAGDEELSFRQALLRDAAYALLPKKERGALHARVAASLRAHGGGRSVAALAATHLELAGQPLDAARLWLDVGRQALDAGVPGEALGWATEARRAGGGAEAALLAARSHLMLGQFAPAAAEAADSGSAEARLVASRALAMLGRQEESLAAAVAADAEGSGGVGTRLCLAERLVEVARYDEALAVVEDAGARIAALAPAEGTVLEASRQRLLGQLRRARGDFAGSLAAHEKQGDLLRAANRPGDLATSLLEQGNLLRELARMEDARGRTREAAALFATIGNRHGRANALQGLSSLARVQGDLDGARVLLREVLDLFRELGTLPTIASALSNLAIIDGMRGHDDEAFAGWHECLAILQKIGDRAGIATTYHNMAVTHANRQRFPAALELYRKSLAIGRETGDRPATAKALIMIGTSLMHLRDFDGAAASQKEALEQLEGIGAPDLTVMATHRSATIAHVQGRLEEARAHLERAEGIIRKLGHPAGMIESGLARGNLYMDTGDWAKARAAFEEALLYSRKINARPPATEARLGLAEVSEYEGDDAAVAAQAGELLKELLEAGNSVDAWDAQIMLSRRPAADAATHAATALAYARTAGDAYSEGVAAAALAAAEARAGRAEAAGEALAVSRRRPAGSISLRWTCTIRESQIRALRALGETVEADRLRAEAMEQARAAGAAGWERRLSRT
ncbi:MAG: adenylate/guanylate cyclase domain-containing protein [Planctomycetota bacterium]